MKNICEIHGPHEDSWEGYLPKAPNKDMCFHCFLNHIEFCRVRAYNVKDSPFYNLPARPTTRQLWNAFLIQTKDMSNERKM